MLNRHFTKVKQYLILLAIISMFFISCDDNGVLPIFQPSYDLDLGKQMDAQIKADVQTYPPYTKNNAAEATQYLQGIVDELIKAPEIKYRGTFAYKVTLVDADVINAFATPGGYIYVYTGLLKYVESEAELAAILGHEITHADNRHSIQTIQKQYGVSFLVSLFVDQNSSEITQLATDLLTNAAFMQNSQADETDADETSFKYLKSTNKWYPGAAKYFFSRMLKDKKDNPNIVEKFLSTHPADEDRVKNIEKLLKDNNISEPTEANLFKTRYTDFKNSIQ